MYYYDSSNGDYALIEPYKKKFVISAVSLLVYAVNK